MKAKTLVSQLASWASKKPAQTAIRGKEGGAWKALTWSEYWTSAREVAKGLLSLGHQVGECVAIVGDNRIGWVQSQFGIMACRGIPAPIYTTNTKEQTAYIVRHSKAKIAICDNQAQLDKYFAGIQGGLMSVDHIITMDDLKHSDKRVMSLSALREKGRQESDTELDKRINDLTDSETALLIYTSGTTGIPKAVQLDHGGMTMIADSIVSCFPFFQDEGSYRAVSYLPLCHVAEQLFTNFLHMHTGGEVAFCPDLKQIRDYLVEIRPTLFLGVPRVWEKFQAVLEARLAEAKGVKKKLADWARKTELACFNEETKRGRPYWPLTRKLANKLVLSKIKERLGLDKLLCAATGAAPISVDTLNFFASIGICVYEGYGMSETTGVATCPQHGKPSFGTVGTPLKGVSVKIADDGEILLKGRNMTQGYLHMPAETAELFDADGWVQTGDLGSLDSKGNLKITGRKKELLITAGGKNVAPSEMEAYMKSIVGVGQSVVVGDRQPYLAALIALDPENRAGLASVLGLPAETSLADIAGHPSLQAYLKKEIEEQCNKKVAQYQTIKKFHVVPTEFSVDGGELTPTMKLRRQEINKKYHKEIENLFKGKD